MTWIKKKLNQFGNSISIGLSAGNKTKGHRRTPKLKKVLKSVLEEIKRKKIPTSSRIFKVDQDIAKWKEYIDKALSPPYFNRFDLYLLYDRIINDAHLSAQITTRKNGTLAEHYVVTDDNFVVDKEATELIQRVWFQEIIDTILDKVFWGTTACETSELLDGEIQTIERINSSHISLERSALIPNPSQVTTTIPLQRPLTNWMLLFGKPGDLGILAKAARYALYKEFGVSDWSRHSERFGTPFTTVKTAAFGDELDNYEKMLSNFGNNGWAILDEDDEVDLLEQKATKPFEMYKEIISFCDEQISKLIVGQTGTADQKSFVGSANVQERILHWYVEADMKTVANEMNNKVFPYLIEKGYTQLTGKKFAWQYFIDKNNHSSKPKPKPRPGEELKLSFNEYIENFYKGCRHY